MVREKHTTLPQRSIHIPSVTLIIIGMLCIVSVSASASEFTWNCATASCNWNDPGAWTLTAGDPDDDGLPDRGDHVVFNGTSSGNANMNVEDSYVASLTVIAGYTGTLTLTGTFNSDGWVVCVSASQLDTGSEHFYFLGDEDFTVDCPAFFYTAAFYNDNNVTLMQNMNVGNLYVKDLHSLNGADILATRSIDLRDNSNWIGDSLIRGVGTGNLNLNIQEDAHFVDISKSSGEMNFPGSAKLDQLSLSDHTFDLDGATINATQFIVNDGAILTGSGTLNGPVEVRTGGTLTPPHLPNIMTVNGDLVMTSDSFFVLDIPDAAPGSHTQITVNGAVDVSGAIIDGSSGAASDVGEHFSLILNDSADDVTGTFSGLSEGDTLTIGENDYTVTYSDSKNDTALLGPAGVVGRLWNDLNENGADDSEPGIANVTMNFLQAGTPLVQTITDASGNYTFVAPSAGTYTVDVDEASPSLAGFIHTDGSEPREVILADNEKLSANFGYQENDPPVITSDGGGDSATVNAQENQTSATDVDASDDVDDTLSYSLTGGHDQMKFRINSSTGVLTFAVAPDFESPADSDDNGVYNVQVTVTDDGAGTLTDVQNLAVTVTDINEFPVITSSGGHSTVTMSEDTTPTAFSLTLHASDVDGDKLTWSISSAAGHGVASASGVGTSKEINYSPVNDYNGSDSFVVQVDDGQGGSATHTINIVIDAINDTPNFNAMDPPEILLNAGPQVVSNWVSDFSPGPTNEANQKVQKHIVSNVSNPDFFVTEPSVDTAGNLSYTTVNDTIGKVTFNVQVRDNGGTANGGIDTSSAQIFTISVYRKFPWPMVLQTITNHAKP